MVLDKKISIDALAKNPANRRVLSMRYRFFDPFVVVDAAGKEVSFRDYLFDRKVPVEHAKMKDGIGQAEAIMLPEDVTIRKVAPFCAFGVSDSVAKKDFALKKGTILLRCCNKSYGTTRVFDVCDAESFAKNYYFEKYDCEGLIRGALSKARER